MQAGDERDFGKTVRVADMPWATPCLIASLFQATCPGRRRAEIGVPEPRLLRQAGASLSLCKAEPRIIDKSTHSSTITALACSIANTIFAWMVEGGTWQVCSHLCVSMLLHSSLLLLHPRRAMMVL